MTEPIPPVTALVIGDPSPPSVDTPSARFQSTAFSTATDGCDRRGPRRGSRAGVLTSQTTKAVTGHRTPKC
jgi:hypothetical protein